MKEKENNMQREEENKNMQVQNFLVTEQPGGFPTEIIKTAPFGTKNSTSE